MGLAELTEQSSSDELWKSAVIKGQVSPWIKECEDMVRLDKEEHDTAQAIYTALNKWLGEDPENKKKLQDFKQGFSLVHTDGFKYRIIQFKDKHLKISKWKPSAGGAGARGGFQKSAYIHMRTDTVQLVHFEELKALIDNQEDLDNWKVTALAPDQAGPLFLVENLRPYTPQVGSSNEEGNKEDKEEEQQQSQEGG